MCVQRNSEPPIQRLGKIREVRGTLKGQDNNLLLTAIPYYHLLDRRILITPPSHPVNQQENKEHFIYKQLFILLD